MKKKLILLPLILLSMTGCKGRPTTAGEIASVSEKDNGITLLCTHCVGEGDWVSFIRDSYTDNIYIRYFERSGYGGGGGMTPYYNAQGEIMKYSEFKEVHVH